MKKRIAVLGDGAWGTAVAQALSEKNSVTLWCYDATVSQTIASAHENTKYLAHISLSPSIHPTTSLETALEAESIFVAVPVAYLRSVLAQCAPYARTEHHWILLSKGIEQKTCAVPSDVLVAEIGSSSWSVLAGPSYARDLAVMQPTGFTVGAATHTALYEMQNLFPSYCTFEYSQDTVGVQLYSALKNIIALGIGIIEGAGYTNNTQALFFMRLFDECSALVTACGGSTETRNALAGLGDAVLTAFGSLSKNKKLGMRIGAGMPLVAALTEFPTAPESVNTLESAYESITHKKITTPVFNALYACVHGNGSVDTIVQTLLN